MKIKSKISQNNLKNGNPKRSPLSLMGSIVYLGIICLLLAGCSRFEQSEKEKLRRRNCQAEWVYRNADDSFYPIVAPEHTPRRLYPWEAEVHLPRITRE